MKECGFEREENEIGERGPTVAIKTMARFTSASRNTRGVPDIQELLSWAQGSVYTE